MVATRKSILKNYFGVSWLQLTIVWLLLFHHYAAFDLRLYHGSAFAFILCAHVWLNILVKSILYSLLLGNIQFIWCNSWFCQLENLCTQKEVVFHYIFVCKVCFLAVEDNAIFYTPFSTWHLSPYDYFKPVNFIFYGLLFYFIDNKRNILEIHRSVISWSAPSDGSQSTLGTLNHPLLETR